VYITSPTGVLYTHYSGRRTLNVIVCDVVVRGRERCAGLGGCLNTFSAVRFYERLSYDIIYIYFFF